MIKVSSGRVAVLFHVQYLNLQGFREKLKYRTVGPLVGAVQCRLKNGYVTGTLCEIWGLDFGRKLRPNCRSCDRGTARRPLRACPKGNFPFAQGLYWLYVELYTS